MRVLKQSILLCLFFLLFNSCKVFYPNYLLRDTKDFYYYELQEVENQKQVILPEDELSFRLYTRDGFNLVDVLGGEVAGLTSEGTTYSVKEDGYVELPLLGELYVKGMTRLQLEKLLEDKYSVWYNGPFIQLKVTNRRAYVFKGIGEAQVLNLPSENTKLIEAIALIGGLGEDTKSSKIKIIRGNYDSPSIKKVDLSTIAGLKDADFIIQPNDLIIIDPKLRPGQAVVKELNYFLTLITTISTVYLLALSIAK